MRIPIVAVLLALTCAVPAASVVDSGGGRAVSWEPAKPEPAVAWRRSLSLREPSAGRLVGQSFPPRASTSSHGTQSCIECPTGPDGAGAATGSSASCYGSLPGTRRRTRPRWGGVKDISRRRGGPSARCTSRTRTGSTRTCTTRGGTAAERPTRGLPDRPPPSRGTSSTPSVAAGADSSRAAEHRLHRPPAGRRDL